MHQIWEPMISKIKKEHINNEDREKLRILVVIGVFPVISNPFILNQITGLIDLGHDVSIFTMRVDDSECEHAEVENYHLRKKLLPLKKLPSSTWGRIQYVLRDGISLIFQKPRVLLTATRAILAGNSLLSFSFFHQLNTVANFPEKEFDIIHAQFGNLGNMVMMLREFGILQGKLVTHFRGFDVDLTIRSEGEHYYDALFSSGDLFLAASEFIMEKVIALGAPPDKTYVQYSGIDIAKFDYRYKQRDTIESTLKIGSIGRLIEKKGYAYVIKALSILKKEGYKFTYEIVGDGELKKEISDLIDRLGLSREVVLLGTKNHDFIAKFLHEIDIFVSHNVTAKSGDHEGSPNTIKEAMLSGVPVFTTYHAGIPDFVVDKVSGFLTDEKDIQQLVNTLKEFAFPLQSLEHITSNARKTVMTEYDNDNLIVGLVNHYYSLLSS